MTESFLQSFTHRRKNDAAPYAERKKQAENAVKPGTSQVCILSCLCETKKPATNSSRFVSIGIRSIQISLIAARISTTWIAIAGGRSRDEDFPSVINR